MEQTQTSEDTLEGVRALLARRRRQTTELSEQCTELRATQARAADALDELRLPMIDGDPQAEQLTTEYRAQQREADSAHSEAESKTRTIQAEISRLEQRERELDHAAYLEEARAVADKIAELAAAVDTQAQELRGAVQAHQDACEDYVRRAGKLGISAHWVGDERKVAGAVGQAIGIRSGLDRAYRRPLAEQTMIHLPDELPTPRTWQLTQPADVDPTDDEDEGEVAA